MEATQPFGYGLKKSFSSSPKAFHCGEEVMKQFVFFTILVGIMASGVWAETILDPS
jgi:hypothetical protein